ncbi:hypothetical protein ACIPYS_17710 [Kitasatospora sp. NPDC089913]|uniref:hypothetical protein n=1 Tax=Kitasatospora sp. NPDC089913 TaxID=3364080 RepID=UPI00382E9E53
MTGYYASFEIKLALEDARDLIAEELTDSENYMDLMDLFAATFKKALRDPEVDFGAVVKDEYEGAKTVDEVKSWWGGWK